MSESKSGRLTDFQEGCKAAVHSLFHVEYYVGLWSKHSAADDVLMRSRPITYAKKQHTCALLEHLTDVRGCSTRQSATRNHGVV